MGKALGQEKNVLGTKKRAICLRVKRKLDGGGDDRLRKGEYRISRCLSAISLGERKKIILSRWGIVEEDRLRQMPGRIGSGNTQFKRTLKY